VGEVECGLLQPSIESIGVDNRYVAQPAPCDLAARHFHEALLAFETNDRSVGTNAL